MSETVLVNSSSGLKLLDVFMSRMRGQDSHLLGYFADVPRQGSTPPLKRKPPARHLSRAATQRVAFLRPHAKSTTEG